MDQCLLSGLNDPTRAGKKADAIQNKMETRTNFKLSIVLKGKIVDKSI